MQCTNNEATITNRQRDHNANLMKYKILFLFLPKCKIKIGINPGYPVHSKTIELQTSLTSAAIGIIFFICFSFKHHTCMSQVYVLYVPVISIATPNTVPLWNIKWILQHNYVNATFWQLSSVASEQVYSWGADQCVPIFLINIHKCCTVFWGFGMFRWAS